ncbi:DMT family transporter [Flavihumibacter sediminis]|nr:DMT family transporter [Flavihumibacter sediminis]
MHSNTKLVNWLLFSLLSIIWGSSFILMKAGITALSAYQVAAIRMLSAGLVLLPIVVKQFIQTSSQSLVEKTILREKMGLIILSGLLGSFFPAFLFCIAETRIDSSLAGILNALTPLFTIILGALFFQLEVNFLKISGVITGFAGLVLLFISGGHVNIQDIGYASLVLIATILYGLNVNMVGKYLKGVGSVTIAAFAFAFLIPPSLAVLWYTGYFKLNLLMENTLLSTAASVVIGVFGTAIASILFYMLVKRAGTLFSSLVTYGIPFVAISWGLLYGETISLLQVICLGVILSGVWMVNKGSRQIKQP